MSYKLEVATILFQYDTGQNACIWCGCSNNMHYWYFASDNVMNPNIPARRSTS